MNDKEFAFTIRMYLKNRETPYQAYLSAHLENGNPVPHAPVGVGRNEYEAIADLCQKMATLMPQ